MTETPTTDSAGSTKQQVLEAIAREKISPSPRWRHVLGTALYAAACIVCGMLLLYLVSLAFHVVLRSGAWYGPAFGVRGVRAFFAPLPWWLIVLAVACLAAVDILGRRYSFGYRRPALATLGLVTAAVVIGGYLIELTPFHSYVGTSPRLVRYPLPVQLYRDSEGGRFNRVYPGRVVKLYPGSLVLKELAGDEFMVVLPTATPIHALARLELGDFVVVFGDRTGTSVKAFGVKEMQQPSWFREPIESPGQPW